MALGFTHPLTEMSTGIILESKALPARKDYNFTAMCNSRLSRKYGILDVSLPYGSTRCVTRIEFSFVISSKWRMKNFSSCYVGYKLSLRTFVTEDPARKPDGF
jgi:hypothetical protein